MRTSFDFRIRNFMKTVTMEENENKTKTCGTAHTIRNSQRLLLLSGATGSYATHISWTGWSPCPSTTSNASQPISGSSSPFASFAIINCERKRSIVASADCVSARDAARLA